MKTIVSVAIASFALLSAAPAFAQPGPPPPPRYGPPLAAAPAPRGWELNRRLDWMQQRIDRGRPGGYLFSPGRLDMRGEGATHAWCEVFLPDLGWIEFDPTNGLAESPDLIPIALARTPDEAAPICGALIGDPGDSRMEVHVDV